MMISPFAYVELSKFRVLDSRLLRLICSWNFGIPGISSSKFPQISIKLAVRFESKVGQLAFPRSNYLSKLKIDGNPDFNC